ncbi:tRNA synthetases class I-domain-containing protein [Panaeolus papilionaceus]|nr:tRNA synthetases class I-domain-containing protein [Panaeolus papilionaceus]
MVLRPVGVWCITGARCTTRKQVLSRYLSSSNTTAPSKPPNFSDTLALPRTSFPLRRDPKEVDVAYQKLSCDELYKWQWKNAKGPLFVFHDGPPYANGDLHMGHALNKIIKDIINRFHVSQGRRVHYVPGWDCHGLPIENKAMKDLDMDPLKTSPLVIREAARKTALREIDSQKAQFRTMGIMANWDSSEDTYRTLDSHYTIRQLRIFQKMVEKGLIYRQHRPVYYSPSSRSALAEAELEYVENHNSDSVYVQFNLPLERLKQSNPVIQKELDGISNAQLLVWTTTPWTLTANMGIAVHQELTYEIVKATDENLEHAGRLFVIATERKEALQSILGSVETICSFVGSDLVGCTYEPIFRTSTLSRSLPIVHASHVTSQSGTGLVHCAPAHGAEDYLTFRSNGLLSGTGTGGMICHVNKEGQFSSEISEVIGKEAAEQLEGKDILGKGNKAMVALLQQNGSIIKVQRIQHRYPYDWKTKKPVVVIATSQWFADLERIKGNALDALKEVNFFPEHSRNRLESFVQSRSEWCISRQRVWGVPIPALYHVPSNKVVLDGPTLGHIINVMETKGVTWWDGAIEDFVPPWLMTEEYVSGGNTKPVSEIWMKGQDTMDVWFDSGTSWSMLSELEVGRGQDPVAPRKFDADMCLEGSDQHRGWFQSQLLTAIGSMDANDAPVSPYAGLITHGMVLDEKGKKMSKSLGNIISPMSIINGTPTNKKDAAHGINVLRMWAASVDYWKDMSIGPTVISQAVESLRKLRNSARFCLGNMGDAETMRSMERVHRSEMGLAERYMMNELYSLEQSALEGYRSYDFPKVMNALNNFTNITLSSLYFDITKDCLYANSLASVERRAVVTVLEKALETLTRVMAPVLPYLAEEIHATWKGDGKSVFMTPWTPLGEEWKDPQAAEDMASLLSLRGDVLVLLEKARSAKQIKSALEAEVDIIIPDGLFDNKFVDLLRRDENFLKTLFIVSDAVILDEGSLGTSSPAWVHSHTVEVPGSDDDIAIRVRPASLHKCPRCWTYTRPEEDELCGRCVDVVTELKA